jgi:hypothetical protein
VSQRAEVAVLTVTASPQILEAVTAGVPDLCDAGSVKDFRLVTAAGTDLSVHVELAPTDSIPAPRG